jgi:hypothetical protein
MPKHSTAQQALLPSGRQSAHAGCLYDRVIYFSTLARWAVPLNGRLRGVYDRLMQWMRMKAHKGAGVVDWAAAFQAADESGDGILQRREFARLLRYVVQDIPADDIAALADAFDRDGSGGVDLEEFVVLMRNK